MTDTPIPILRGIRTEAELLHAAKEGLVFGETYRRFISKIQEMEQQYSKQIAALQVGLQHCERLRTLLAAVSGEVENELFPVSSAVSVTAPDAPPPPTESEKAVLSRMSDHRAAGKCDYIERLSLGPDSVCSKKVVKGTDRCKQHQ